MHNKMVFWPEYVTLFAVNTSVYLHIKLYKYLCYTQVDTELFAWCLFSKTVD